LKYIQAETPYIFSVTPNVSITAGGFVTVEFKTSDELHPAMFEEAMGFTFATGETAHELSCREVDANHVISDDQITCELFKGVKSPYPSQPATLRIPIMKNIAAGTEIAFSVFKLKNPDVHSYPVPITIKLQSLCWKGDPTKPCTIYSSTQYITYDSTPVSIPGVSSARGSISESVAQVSAISDHTIGYSMSVDTGDFIRVCYPADILVPAECTVASGGVCWSYPRENCMIIKVTAQQTSSYSFRISQFTNLHQYYNDYVNFEIYNSVSG